MTCNEPSGGPTELLDVRSVSRTYDDGTVCALKGVSFTIGRGEYVAIMGPSGSGKSTLLNLLGALDHPSQGEICFEGQPLCKMRNLDQFRARTIGFVFQSFHLLPTLTALENVQIPMFEGPLDRRGRIRKAEELLCLVGLSHRLKHVPQKLSVGERQRVAIARALANDPSVLLADEPTGNLDSRAGAGVLDLFDHLHRERGVTLVVITHGAEVAARAERTIWIRDGQIDLLQLNGGAVVRCAV
ncbi:MAG TPA: ABC transporter ATP-binding protein [Planctomycetaceae bacterium]|jgi:putative ABC transport system ATP-binding protein|nr:ABC transporter ATP-binding protein [Planctomycetaceae bacterium]